MSTRKWSELKDQMSPERRARVDAQVQEELADLKDNEAWAAHGRMYSSLDNEALSRYFSHLASLPDDEKARVKAAFEKATNDGWRPKHAVKRALAPVAELADAAASNPAVDET